MAVRHLCNCYAITIQHPAANHSNQVTPSVNLFPGRAGRDFMVQIQKWDFINGLTESDLSEPFTPCLASVSAHKYFSVAHYFLLEVQIIILRALIDM